MNKDLNLLFNPRSIAIIGASQDGSGISGQPLRFLKSHGYRGRLYPINPKYADVQGERCYAKVDDLPETPDLALLLVPAKRVPETIAACGAKGIPFAIVYSSGFAELNEAGRQAQVDIAATAARYGIGIIGPNCQGMINVAEDVYAGFGAPFSLSYQKGTMSLVSQSGGFGCALLMMADEEGIGFRHFITTGNESGISTLDLVEYFCADPNTRVVGVYVEGFKDAARLLQTSRKALDAKKPLLMWKVGNTEAGAKAAASHTANLGGALTLYRAAFRQSGVIEVFDVSDLSDCARAFLAGRLPRGNRIALVTISGGAGVLMADHCTEAGMTLPQLTMQSLERLRPIMPGFAALDNPIDVTAGIMDDPDMLDQGLAIIAGDPNVDCIAVACGALSGAFGLALARAVVKAQANTDKPIFLAWNARFEMASEAYALVDENRIPRFRTPVRCARAFGALSQYAAALERFATRKGEQPLRLDRPDERAKLRGCQNDLTEFEAKQVLAAYGIPVTRETLAHTRTEALAQADASGYPLVMKVQSPGIPHKTEAGAVRLGIADREAVGRAWDEIMVNARRHAPGASIDGLLVQEQVAGAIEVILGVNNDPLFGPAVMFGLGGIFAEVMQDVSFRIAPVTLGEALDMIREIRAFPILNGARGKPKADIEALADAIVHLSALALDLKNEVAELDINPLFVFPAGGGVKAGDALIKPAIRPMEGA